MTYVDSTIDKIKFILEKVKSEKYFSYFGLDEKAKKNSGKAGPMH